MRCIFQKCNLQAILTTFYMTFNRLVNYESSIGDVSFKAIRSLSDRKSSINFLTLIRAYFSVTSTMYDQSLAQPSQCLP